MSEYKLSQNPGPIGVFDSGFGGLTVLKEMQKQLPQYDFLYLGDNARTPYGTRSFDTIYQYTLEAVKYLFNHGCHLIILACNTASAKALRTIQQKDLPQIDKERRVLGVIRPTAEVISSYSQTGHVGILGTSGTIKSESYLMEINKLSPHLIVNQHACPMWVPLVENHEAASPGADYFINKDITQIMNTDPMIDTLLLACTHYPILLPKIKKLAPQKLQILTQGEIVAKSLQSYLHRHPEIDEKCSKNSHTTYITTDTPEPFNIFVTKYYAQVIKSTQIHL